MTTSSDNRAPAPVTRPGFYEVRTPDPDRLVHYYQDALGLVVTERSGSATYLTTGVDHHCVIVQQGERDGRVLPLVQKALAHELLRSRDVGGIGDGRGREGHCSGLGHEGSGLRDGGDAERASA